MTSDDTAKQDQEWADLHDRIDAVLQRFGRKDAFGDGDYWPVDESSHWYLLQVEVQNLRMLKPDVVAALQAALAGYPDWEIAMGVDIQKRVPPWPGMGLVIRHDEIIDELRREFLPEEFRNLGYSGERP
jgi:hypothetical protein